MPKITIACLLLLTVAVNVAAQETDHQQRKDDTAPSEAHPPLPVVTKDCVLWYAPSTEKIKPDQKPPAEAAAISLAGARNETESLQIVIHGRSALTQVDLTLSDFRGPGDSRIPSTAGTLFRVNFVDCGDKGRLPDSMVPWIDSVSGRRIGGPYGAPFDVVDGQNVPVWLEIDIPPDAVPGKYTGQVTVRQGEAIMGRLPIHLTVWPITLPKTTQLLTYFCLNWNKHPKQAYFHRLHEHRIDVWYLQGGHQFRRDARGKAVVEWDANFDRRLDAYFDGSLFKDGVPGKSYLFGYGMWNLLEVLQKNRDDRAAVLKQFEAHYGKKPWIKNTAWFFIDEPTEKNMAECRRVGRQIRKYSPSIGYLLTTGFSEKLQGLVTIWDPIINREVINWDAPGPTVYRKEMAAGRQVINCITVASKNPTCPNLFIQFPGMNTRIWTWVTWHLGHQGIEFWDTKPAPAVTTPSKYGEAWGDGSLFYRGMPAELGIAEEIALPSIRLKMIRDGIEDYELLAMLRRKDPQAAKRVGRMMCQATAAYDHSFAKPVQHMSWNRNTDGKGERPVPGYVVWESSHERLAAARAALAEALTQ